MNYDADELLARLADEYVLGTLRGRARSRFESLLGSNERARGQVRRAEDQWLALSLALPTVQPDAATWTSIAVRVGIPAASPAARSRPERTTWRVALAAAVAVCALGIAWFMSERTPAPTAVANLATTAGAPLWTVSTFDEDSRLQVAVTGTVQRETGRSYELWALPDGGAPVSLGLLPEDGQLGRDLTATQLAALRLSPKLAVSLEPSGGSRTGAPTGPVLYVAELQVNPAPS